MRELGWIPCLETLQIILDFVGIEYIITEGVLLEIIVVNERKNKTLNLNIKWSVIVLIMIFIFTVFVLFIYGVINFAKGKVDYKRLHQLTKENRMVQREIEYMESEIKTIYAYIDTLVKKDTVFNHFSGLLPLEDFVNNRMADKIFEDTVSDIKLSQDLDKILVRVQQQYIRNKKIVEYLNKKENAKNYIPSIMPVNGWFIRGVGYYPDPFTGTVRLHEGIDIAAPVGTPIIAPADGIVRRIQNRKDFGIVIEISHSEGFETVYAHCQNPVVNQGRIVKRGDIIAYVGTSGKVTGPHLHYEIRIGGVPVDPLDFIISKKIDANE